MTTDYLDIARRRRDAIRQGVTWAPGAPSTTREISQKSQESGEDGGLISHNSLFSQSVTPPTSRDGPLLRAQARTETQLGDTTSRDVEPDGEPADPDQVTSRSAATMWPQADREISEISEKSPSATGGRGLTADPFRAWRLRNARLLSKVGGQTAHDYGGFCAVHRRLLSYPEQKRGACSWCVPVDPEHEPEYWASHWRRFTEER
jgi:hypothetical protein